MIHFDHKTDKLFKKTNDVIIDGIIKYVIYNQYFTTFIIFLLVEIPLLITAIVYGLPILSIPMILFLIFMIIFCNNSKFSDKFYSELSEKFHNTYCSFYQEQYEYTEKLSKELIELIEETEESEIFDTKKTKSIENYISIPNTWLSFNE